MNENSNFSESKTCFSRMAVDLLETMVLSRLVSLRNVVWSLLYFFGLGRWPLTPYFPFLGSTSKFQVTKNWQKSIKGKTWGSQVNEEPSLEVDLCSPGSRQGGWTLTHLECPWTDDSLVAIASLGCRNVLHYDHWSSEELRLNNLRTGWFWLSTWHKL